MNLKRLFRGLALMSIGHKKEDAFPTGHNETETPEKTETIQNAKFLEEFCIPDDKEIYIDFSRLRSAVDSDWNIIAEYIKDCNAPTNTGILILNSGSHYYGETTYLSFKEFLLSAKINEYIHVSINDICILSAINTEGEIIVKKRIPEISKSAYYVIDYLLAEFERCEKVTNQKTIDKVNEYRCKNYEE